MNKTKLERTDIIKNTKQLLIKNEEKNTKWKRNCPNCKQHISYTLYTNFRRAVRKNSVCKMCMNNKGQFNTSHIPANKGKKLSKETIEKIKLARAKQIITDEHKKNLRLAAIKDLSSKTGITPNYNPVACNIINEYGKQHGYNFQHAENGGEFYIKDLGYWVDGYDKEKNVVIEIYENRWHLGKNIIRDVRRKKEIVKYLKCKFIEIRIK